MRRRNLHETGRAELAFFVMRSTGSVVSVFLPHLSATQSIDRYRPRLPGTIVLGVLEYAVPSELPVL